MKLLIQAVETLLQMYAHKIKPTKMKKVLVIFVLVLISCADIKQREQDRFNEIQKSNNEIRIQ